MRAGANVGFPRWKYARNGAIHTACTTANGAFSRNTTWSVASRVVDPAEDQYDGGFRDPPRERGTST